MDDNLKLNPYDRLKSILNEGELTEKGSNNLDQILGIEKQKQNKIIEKILLLFKKIDGFIFKKPNRMYNTTYYKRK